MTALAFGNRDFNEDSHMENGNYLNVCIECGSPFIGHKHRPVCRSCSNPPAGHHVERCMIDDGEPQAVS